MSGIPQIAGYPMPGEADPPPNTARWTVGPVAGVQFHPESVLSRGGVRVLGTLSADVLTGVPRPARA